MNTTIPELTLTTSGNATGPQKGHARPSIRVLSRTPRRLDGWVRGSRRDVCTQGGGLQSEHSPPCGWRHSKVRWKSHTTHTNCRRVRTTRLFVDGVFVSSPFLFIFFFSHTTDDFLNTLSGPSGPRPAGGAAVKWGCGRRDVVASVSAGGWAARGQMARTAPSGSTRRTGTEQNKQGVLVLTIKTNSPFCGAQATTRKALKC